MADDNILTNLEKNNESFLEKFVGDGKKYKDIEELAKAYAHADKHIQTMNEDNTNLRGEFEAFRELTTKQIAEASKAREPNPLDQRQPSPEPKPAHEAPPKASEVDLDARIAQVLEETDERKRLNSNAEIAQEVMVKVYGDKDKALEAVKKRAEELRVNPQFIADIAFRSPDAFFSTMGIDPAKLPRSSNSPAPSSDVNIQAFDKNNPSAARPGTYEYYQEIRRKEPRRYFSVEIQSQMMKDAMEQGQDFYAKR